MIFSQWAQLYTDTQYATIEIEASKQLNLAALYFDNTEWRNECKRADQATLLTQRVNPPCKATPLSSPPRGYKRGRGAAPTIRTPGAKRQEPMPRPPAPAAVTQRCEDPRQAGGARPRNMFAAFTQQPRPRAVPGRTQGTTTVLAKPERAAARRKAGAAGEGGRTRVTRVHERWDIPCCCNEVHCGISVEGASAYAHTGCGKNPW